VLRRRSAILGALVLIGCSVADDEAPPVPQSAAEAPSVDAAVAELQVRYPGARVVVEKDRIRRVYGLAAGGRTPDAAADEFRRASAPVFGLAPEDLKPTVRGGATPPARSAATASEGIGLMVDRATGRPKFRLFEYAQERDGIPVFRAGLRMLVREDGDHPVVWANADLRSIGSFHAPAGARVGAVDLEKSLQALRSGTFAQAAGMAPSALTDLGTPTPTIFAGAGSTSVAPRLAMRYTAADARGPGRWTFVADAATGEILFAESDVHFDIQGSVLASVTTGSAAMGCAPLGTEPLPYANVSSAAGDAVTDAAGAFTIVESGSGTVTVTSGLTGEYFFVNNEAGDEHALSLQVAPPGPANFLHQDPANPPELVLAQLNAYNGANELRDMLLSYVPDYPGISGQTDFPIYVNHNVFTCELSGGAWYDDEATPRTINFCQGTAERANTAFGSIVHHEYGHHIIDSGGSLQNEYGEGMADTIAMLFSGDPRIGVGYHPEDCSEPLRYADRDCQYSETECSTCGPGIYECGALLSGTIWDVWQELNASDPANADDIIRSLVFSSIPLHTGTSIDASIALDMLTLDDDDALVENGTPHYMEICAGFAAHGMNCPPIVDGLVVQGADLDSEGPSDGPFEPVSATYTLHNLGPEETLGYAVVIPPDAAWLVADSAGGTIAFGEEATVTVSIDAAVASTLPDGDYSTLVTFVNETSGEGTVTREARLRVGALEPVYTATFDTGLDGFSVDEAYGNLWHWGTACVDPLPGHSAPGSLYYGREDRCNFTTSVPILHTITSGPILVENPGAVELGFNYYLRTENDPNYDQASVLVSVDGGPFETVASNNTGGEPLVETTAWQAIEFDITPLMPAVGPASLQIRLSFNAFDPENNTQTGFVVDDITVSARPIPPQTCASDEECDDGLVCNGAEACTDEVCVAGMPVLCDDGVSCTVDACDESTGACVSAPDDAVCDDGMACNGVETCDPSLDCQVGEPLVCDDGNACTNDFCDDGVGCVFSSNTNPCDDDGDECTDDVCSDGACTHPDNGTCAPAGPCDAFCANPVVYGGTHFQSGNLGTGGTCHETLAPLRGGVCGNFAWPRRLFVNGVPMTCNWNVWPWLPPPVNGGYCIRTSPGNHPWAGFSTWTW